MIRPRPARWFELLVARDDTTLALEALAATGAVELEARAGAALPAAFADLAPLLPQYAELAARYRAFWPRTPAPPSPVPARPHDLLQRALDRLRAWAAQAEPRIRRLQDAEREHDALGHWRAVAALLREAGSPIDLARAAAQPAVLELRLAVWPPGAAPALPEGTQALLAPLPQPGVAARVLTLGPPAAQQLLAQQVLAAKGLWLAPPPWLASDPALTERLAAEHQAALAAVITNERAAIERAGLAHGLPQALADVQRLQWVLDNVHGLESRELFCSITGWTSLAADALETAIDRAGARALLRLAAPPPGARAPMLLSNPPWARPFELFARALGMPSGNEADPSVLLAIAVPAMFGYMFGDLGQGLLIAAAGWMLRKRFPIARLFIAGGLAAAAFGLVWGSVFALHVMPPLWLAPLDDPLAVLLLPIAGGAALLTLGLLLAALEASWRGEFASWWARDAGFVLAYLALVVAPLQPAALAVAALAALWFCLGRAIAERRALAALAAIGNLVERLGQILINTLSFARVGAFTLAHAGLASAIAALMHSAPNAIVAGLVLLLGNALVIALEGLVVSIQTTRLVLFEFFTRFLEGRGRVFRPLPLPPSITAQET